MEQVTTPEVHLSPRQHGDPESSWVVNYMPMIVGINLGSLEEGAG
jgi:hypothetical protein